MLCTYKLPHIPIGKIVDYHYRFQYKSETPYVPDLEDNEDDYDDDDFDDDDFEEEFVSLHDADFMSADNNNNNNSDSASAAEPTISRKFSKKSLPNIEQYRNHNSEDDEDDEDDDFSSNDSSYEIELDNMSPNTVTKKDSKDFSLKSFEHDNDDVATIYSNEFAMDSAKSPQPQQEIAEEKTSWCAVQ